MARRVENIYGDEEVFEACAVLVELPRPVPLLDDRAGLPVEPTTPADASIYLLVGGAEVQVLLLRPWQQELLRNLEAGNCLGPVEAASEAGLLARHPQANPVPVRTAVSAAEELYTRVLQLGPVQTMEPRVAK